MTGLTPIFALPYPDPTDPLAEGADAIKALAQKTERQTSDAAQFRGATLVPPGQSYQFGGLIYELGDTTVTVHSSTNGLNLPAGWWYVHAWIFFGGEATSGQHYMSLVRGASRQAQILGNGSDMLSIDALIYGGDTLLLNLSNYSAANLNASDGRIIVSKVAGVPAGLSQADPGGAPWTGELLSYEPESFS